MRWPLSVGILLLTLDVVPPLSAQVFVRPVIGGSPAASGIAAGLELVRYRTLGPLDARFRGVLSTKKYEQFDFALEAPPPATHDVFWEFRARYRNYPEEDFWGLGPDASTDRRANFRLEDARVTASFGIHTRSGFRAAYRGGFLNSNTGPGQDEDFPSIEEIFSQVEAPALETTPDYWLTGLDLELDRRENRTFPRTGDRSIFRWTAFMDTSASEFSFSQYEIEYHHFFPLARRNRIAARGRLVWTDAFEGHEIPFFLQPTVGGSQTVRGLPQDRFRDRNAFSGNLEYHHRLHALMDGVAFADVGRVFGTPTASETRLHTGMGVGARFRLGTRIFFGMDVGISREGGYLWLRSGQMF